MLCFVREQTKYDVPVRNFAHGKVGGPTIKANNVGRAYLVLLCKILRETHTVACPAVQTDGPSFHRANVAGTRPSGTPKHTGK